MNQVNDELVRELKNFFLVEFQFHWWNQLEISLNEILKEKNEIKKILNKIQERLKNMKEKVRESFGMKKNNEEENNEEENNGE